ncbi:MAG: FAD-dependent oxidoreductase [Microthrixaceae bacterium]
MARLRPPRDQTNYEGWLVARFGWRLYRTFFKTYTEKVWGVPVSSMPADWAAQRVKNLSLSKAIINAVLPNRNQKDIASLIEEFQYPRFGPGMMWERCRDLVEEQGNEVRMRTRVLEIRHADGRATEVVAEHDGEVCTYPAEHVISSMPFPALLKAMSPPAPEAVRTAMDGLSFRDFLTVALVVSTEDTFDDNWIYIHSPAVKVGRIQNFRSWSPYMVKPGHTCLGLEYFVFEGDELWTMDDDDLVELGKRELAQLGLVDPSRIEGGYVVRMRKAYPHYDETYQRNVDIGREWLAHHASNVWPVGRNGMHKYNNQDHSMFTAMLTVENICRDAGNDIWEVNVEDEYHEEQTGRFNADNASSGTASPGSSLHTVRSGTGRDAPIIPSSAPRISRNGTGRSGAADPAGTGTLQDEVRDQAGPSGLV